MWGFCSSSTELAQQTSGYDYSCWSVVSLSLNTHTLAHSSLFVCMKPMFRWGVVMSSLSIPTCQRVVLGLMNCHKTSLLSHPVNMPNDSCSIHLCETGFSTSCGVDISFSFSLFLACLRKSFISAEFALRFDLDGHGQYWLCIYTWKLYLLLNLPRFPYDDCWLCMLLFISEWCLLQLIVLVLVP